MTQNNDDEEGEVLLSINGELVPVGSLKITHHRKGEPIAHREAGVPGGSSDSTATPEGAIVSHQRGAPTQGEEQTLSTCEQLAAVWRDRGEGWRRMLEAPPHEDYDCIGVLGGQPEIRVQVVRADSSPEAYRVLAREREYSTISESGEPRAAVLRAAIQKKADKLGPAQRERLVLALDATKSSAYALGPVISSFRQQFGEWAAALQFQAIWLVGPTALMTYRLDRREPADRA